MTTELYIENQPADISSTLASLLTFAIDDIKDFSSRQTAFSKTIVLPGSQRNNKLFGSVFDVSISNDYNPAIDNININFNPSVSAKCILFQDFLQTFKGTLRLLQINIDNGRIEYEAAITGELSNLNVRLSSGLLENLDFSAYNHAYDVNAIVNSWSNPVPGFGYYYPLIDYGTYSIDKHDWNVYTFRPALYVREYIERMLAAAGFRYSSSFFQTAFFNSLIIPYNRETLTKLSTEIFRADIPSSSSVPWINRLPFTTIGGTYFDSTNAPVHDLFTYNNAISQGTNINYNIFWQHTAAGATIKISLRKNGAAVASYALAPNGGGGFWIGNTNVGFITGDNFDFYTNIATITGVTITAGGTTDTVTVTIDKLLEVPTVVRVEYTQVLGGTNPTTRHTNVTIPAGQTSGSIQIPGGADPNLNPMAESIVSGGPIVFSNANYTSNLYTVAVIRSDIHVTGSSSILVPLVLGDTVDMNLAIPKNIRQVDFFVSIIKLFNLYVIEDKWDENLIYITPFPDYYSEESQNAVEWTYKLDRNKPVKIEPMSEINAKIYNFNYATDSDYYNDLYKKRYNKTYGSRIFDTEFEFVSQKQDVNLIFASTPLVGYAGEDKVYPTIFKLSGNPEVEQRVDSVIRIMQTKRVTGVISWDILNTDGSVLRSLTEYGYAGHFDDPDNVAIDLNFGFLEELFFVLVAGDLTVTCFNVYWSSYMAEITDKDSKMLTGKFYLTPNDILNLDFSKYVNVDGNLFRLNKITDYNLTKPDTCEVELLKVIHTLYADTPTPPAVVLHDVYFGTFATPAGMPPFVNPVQKNVSRPIEITYTAQTLPRYYWFAYEAGAGGAAKDHWVDQSSDSGNNSGLMGAAQDLFGVTLETVSGVDYNYFVTRYPTGFAGTNISYY